MTFISDTVRTRRRLRRAVRELGQSLGPTPGSVAANLATLRVIGTPRDSTNCAIARYLGAVVGAEQSVSTICVSDRSVQLTLTGRRLPLRIALPRPVCRFIQSFDSGYYPGLVDGLVDGLVEGLVDGTGLQPAVPATEPGRQVS